MDECLKKLRASTLLAVGGGWGMPGMGKAIEEVFGTKVVPIEFKELHEAHQKADRDEARQWADRWVKGAEKVVEPTREDIENSGAMCVAMREVMKRHNAQGITINCLGGFYGGHLKAYPCLGFCQFNNDGLVGACEGDLPSTITMLAVGALTGRPGFISDPVIDTSKNQIIYAHCVAPTKVFGPDGKANPYHLRSHSEDRKGAALRSLMPLGYMTTTVEIKPGERRLLLHLAKTVDNIDEDKACRTKLAAEPKGDLDKLLTCWDQWGWHRVTFYGDLREPVQALAKAVGLTVVEEA
jgi:L-fucose isomerase-like protein